MRRHASPDARAWHRREAGWLARALPARSGGRAQSCPARGYGGQDAPNSFSTTSNGWASSRQNPGDWGTIMTATQQMVATLGWGYIAALAKHKLNAVAVGRRSAEDGGGRGAGRPSRRRLHGPPAPKPRAGAKIGARA